MVGFYRVVGVLLGDVLRGGKQLVEHAGVGRWAIGGHLAGPRRVSQGLGEEPAGGRQVALGCGQDVDDLPVLLDRPIQLDAPSGDFHIGFVEEPPVAGGVPARAASRNSG